MWVSDSREGSGVGWGEKTTEGHAVQEAVLKGDQAFRGYLILSFRIFYSNMLIYLSRVNTRELTQHKVRV